LYAINAVFNFLKRHVVLIGFLAMLLWGYEWRHVLLRGDSGSAAVTEREPGAETVFRIEEIPPLAEVSRFRPAEPIYPSEEISDVAADLLQAARRAYWIGDLKTADSLYRHYAEQYPSDPDGYGELGNLLLALDKRDEAIQMFLQAARMLDAQGKHDQAASLRNAAEADGG